MKRLSRASLTHTILRRRGYAHLPRWSEIAWGISLMLVRMLFPLDNGRVVAEVTGALASRQ